MRRVIFFVFIVGMVSIGTHFTKGLNTGKHVEGFYTVVEAYNTEDVLSFGNVNTNIRVLKNKETNHKIKLESIGANPSFAGLYSGDICYVNMKVFKNGVIRLDSLDIFNPRVREGD